MSLRPNLKILIDARMVTGQVHGIARYTVDLIHGLNELGQNVSVILNTKEQAEFLGPTSVKNIEICKARFARPWESVALSRMQLGHYDVIHYPSFALPLNAPWENIVITIHDLIHLEEGGNPFHQVYYKTVVAPALRKAKNIIAVSEWGKSEIEKKLGIPSSKISVVRNGLEPRWFSKNSSEARTSSKPYFISITNKKTHKNLDTLLSACESLWKEGHDFELCLSLGGDEISSRPHLRLLKNISDEELKHLILGARALVSTSQFEGFNYPAAEALALGQAAIVSRGSAHDELTGDNLTVYGDHRDVEALKTCLVAALNKNSTFDDQGKHNIYSRLEMAKKTLEVYARSL